MPMIQDLVAGLNVRDDDEGLFSRDIDGQLVRLDAPTESDYTKEVTLQIDGQEVTVPLAEPLTDANGNIVVDIEGRTTPRYTTILDAAQKLYVKEFGDEQKIPIPTLCHQPHMTPVAVCRLCVVQIYGQKRGKRAAERKLLPACQHPVKNGMEVFTMKAEGRDGDRVRQTVRVHDGVPRRRSPEAGGRPRALARDHPLQRARPDDRARRRRSHALSARRFHPAAEPAAGAEAARRPAQARRLVARLSRRSLGVHSVRALHPRVRRRAGESRHRPHRQGRERGHRVRPQRPDGQIELREVRRVHGLLPHERDHLQARRPDQAQERGPQRGSRPGVGVADRPRLRRRAAEIPALAEGPRHQAQDLERPGHLPPGRRGQHRVHHQARPARGRGLPPAEGQRGRLRQALRRQRQADLPRRARRPRTCSSARWRASPARRAARM